MTPPDMKAAVDYAKRLRRLMACRDDEEQREVSNLCDALLSLVDAEPVAYRVTTTYHSGDVTHYTTQQVPSFATDSDLDPRITITPLYAKPEVKP